MKKKRFIPLILTLAISTSVLGFAPAWGEQGSHAEEQEGEAEKNTDSQDIPSTGNLDAPVNTDDELHRDELLLPLGDEGGSTEDIQFENLDTKDKFYGYFTDKLDPIRISEYLDDEKYYTGSEPYYYELPAYGSPVLNQITKALQEKFNLPLEDEDAALNGIVKSNNGGFSYVIRFKKFEEEGKKEKLAYMVWLKWDDNDGKISQKVLIPLQGTKVETFNFAVNGNANQFNLPKNKEICEPNKKEMINYLKNYYPNLKDTEILFKNNGYIRSEGDGQTKQYYYEIEYTDTNGAKKEARVNVSNVQDPGRSPDELTLFISTNLYFPFDEGRFNPDPNADNKLTEKEQKDIEEKFSRMINNALTGILSVKVDPNIETNPEEGRVEYVHGETYDYGISMTVKTEKHGEVKVVLPITYNTALNVSSVLPLKQEDLNDLVLTKNKKYVYKSPNNETNGQLLKDYLKGFLKEGEYFGEDAESGPKWIEKEIVGKYNKTIHYPVYKENELVRTLKLNLNDAMSLEHGYHNIIFLKNMYPEDSEMVNAFTNYFFTDEDKKDIEKVLHMQLGDSLRSVEFIKDPDDPNAAQNKVHSDAFTRNKYVKVQLHLNDGSPEGRKEVLSVYVEGKAPFLPPFGQQIPPYALDCANICGGEIISPDAPENPNNPNNPNTPNNPVNPGSGNGGGGNGGNGGGGSDPRTPIVNEGETPTVLSASRDNDPSPTGPEVLGAVKEEAPTVLGVARRGLVNTVDSANPFALSLFGLSATGLLFWALEEKKKRA